MHRSLARTLSLLVCLSCGSGAPSGGARDAAAGGDGAAGAGGATCGAGGGATTGRGGASAGTGGGSGGNAGGGGGGGSAGRGGATAGTGGAATAGAGGSAGNAGRGGATAGTGGGATAGTGGSAGNAGRGGATAGSGGGVMINSAPIFNGSTGYVEIPDADVFSESTTGALSVEAWMRPDSLTMPNAESSGYVHWMGKGTSGQHEWVARMYQQGNSEDRANRISFYSFNLTGGLGAGSYFQDTVVVSQWIHYAGTFDDTRTYIFKNGAMRDSDLLSDYSIVPMNGTAPVRIGTRDMSSFFQGSIARVAIYNVRLTEQQILAHYAAKVAGNYDQVVLAEPSLVAFYKLDESSGTVATDSKGGRHGTYRGGVQLAAADWAPP